MLHHIFFQLRVLSLVILLSCGMSCTFYRFSNANIPLEIKTIYIEQFQALAENNTDIQFLPTFRNDFITITANRTRLIVVDNKEKADWIIEGNLDSYRTESVGLSSTDLSTTNLTAQVNQIALKVSMTVRLINKVDTDKQPKVFNVVDNTIVDGSKTLFQIQNEERDNIIKRMVQQLFDQVYSNW